MPVLFEPTASKLVLLAEAELIKVPVDEGAVITMVTVAEAPFAIEPRLQITVVVPLHEPWLEVADTNVVPAGSGSVMLTPLAAPGPLLSVVIVYVI